jgi:hypothetical protein
MLFKNSISELGCTDVYCVGLEGVGLKSKSPGKAAPAPAAANNKKAHKKTVGSQFRNSIFEPLTLSWTCLTA